MLRPKFDPYVYPYVYNKEQYPPGPIPLYCVSCRFSYCHFESDCKPCQEGVVLPGF